MTPIELSSPCYTDEAAAMAHLASIRWPDGKPTCPLCGVMGESRALAGKSMGPGWYYCEACKDKFTVRTGTVYARSHIPLHKWLLAFRLMASSKKGISAHQLARTLNITYKSAWFMGHRIREAMSDTDPSPLGVKDKTVEADETFIGKAEKASAEFVNGIGWVVNDAKGIGGKMKVLTVVERGGKARSVKVNSLRADDLCARIWSQKLTARAAWSPTKPDTTRALARNLPNMRASIIPPMNGCAAMFIVTLSRTISASLSAVCAGRISTAAKPICSVTCMNLTSAIPTGPL